ncbi:hypothetical protein CFC21_023098 [Triticum aestivum]|uniref:2-oxoglutarate (2OG) and Fe(II)-dependent oxygenase superfamily protein n=3 Tax=Triticum TaxID=4564 RepID=A0A9R1PLH8_TRITD|nr:uncharacterized protein LOC123044750 isoform X2 [Triticum aestivum]XP_044323531.1 uncharacterized protein LOC123044750 isoform X2 [Triticum aestivum]XP_044323532.1 uncharacterized protein LOC123044750 isoform X2 [Triticum aestivum]KAF7008322.1 hypothetical protein CFC21_023098 [Triticum aestivum]VAH45598.1 unnamed protein product [Triticum turgidum subsp. durum]
MPALRLPLEIKIQEPSPSMDDAGGDILPSLGRVRLGDLAAVEGLASDSYKICVSTLMQSLAQYSAVIIQLPPADAALLRSGLDSARLFFHQRVYDSVGDVVHSDDAREWKTSGYYADPQMWLEMYDYRPGVTVREHGGAMELSPSGLPDIFSMLGKVCRDILDAVSFSLNLRSCVFTEILDNMPLRSQEVSSSVLSACCHSRPSFEEAQQHGIASPDDSQLLMFSEQEQQIDKTLLTLVKSDRSGLYIKDLHGRWILVDGDLGPHDIVVYPGLALYQETSGYVNPAVHKTEVGNLQGCMFGRCSLAFKLTPRFVARPGGSEMGAAGHGVDTQFQVPVTVTEFMQTDHSADQLFPKNNESSSQAEQDASPNSATKEKKGITRTKSLPPSKRLRLEAQRVLKQRVQDIADRRGIKLRFCNLKECESHIRSLDSPCDNIRTEIGWPQGVPFVHPHDLPNKAKLGFLEAYEPGWTASQQDESQSL